MFDAHVPGEVPRPHAARRRRPDGSQQWYYGEIRGPEPRAERGRRQAAGDVQRQPDALRGDAPRVATTSTSACATCRRAGSWPGLNFPNWTGFSGQVLNQGPDRDVNLVMIKAYNDWHVDEWCGALPRAVHPVRDPPAVRRRGGGRRRCTASPTRAATRSRSPRTRPGSGCRASTPTRGTRCSPRAPTPAPCCAATSARRRRARRPRPTRRRRCR